MKEKKIYSYCIRHDRGGSAWRYTEATTLADAKAEAHRMTCTEDWGRNGRLVLTAGSSRYAEGDVVSIRMPGSDWVDCK